MLKAKSTLTLILGGARSGKSTYAEALAPKLGRNVLYVATAEVLDDEMRSRVAQHQARRPSDWSTCEVPLGVGEALATRLDGTRGTVILIDCLTLLVSNIILSACPGPEEPDGQVAWDAVQQELDEILEAHGVLGGHLIVVSNEVGLGVVPPYSLGRTYRDCLGRANQVLAGAADRVILMVAGLPVDLKELPLAWLA